MEYNRASRPNVVSLFFGMAMALVLIAVLAASLFFNKLPQSQPTDPAFITQSQQSGYTYTEAAATQTVHNKALLLLVALGLMSGIAIFGIVVVGTWANHRVNRQIANFDQNQASNRLVIQTRESFAVNKPQIIRVNNRVVRR